MHRNEEERNEWTRDYALHNTQNGRIDYHIGNVNVCQGAFLWVHDMTNEKFNNALTSHVSGHLLRDHTSVEREQLIAWIHVWARNNTDRDPVSGNLHMHEFMTYHAIWAMYTEGMDFDDMFQ
jgi:hypothetical protein